MPKFSRTSKGILYSCVSDLQTIMNDVIKITDIKIISGLRNEEEQNYLYRMEFSKKMFPNSRHNAILPALSEAVDIAPYPVDWKDEEKFYYVAGIVMGVAGMLGINLRWGGDWDMDTELKDNSFNDLAHYERVKTGG